MKTKNIFKVLAFAMLMPAMMLTTACSSDDDSIINNENTNKKGYEIPVTINVTRQDDNAATRATYTYDSNTERGRLHFSTGDQLYVWGSHDLSGKFSGTLSYESVNSEGTGKFSGTITTEKQYTGTAHALFLAAQQTESIDAVLLPAGYTDYNYFSFNEEGSLQIDYTKAFTTISKERAVEQFCHETSIGYYSNIGFELFPNNATLNFTINGLPSTEDVDVLFIDEDHHQITGTVTPNSSGTVTFAIGVKGSTNLKNCSLTVGGYPITIVEYNYGIGAYVIANITRTVYIVTGHALSASAVGEVVGTDGKAYAVADKDDLPTGVTAAGMVAYKNDTQGLVIALTNEPNKMNRSTAISASGAAAHTPTVEGYSWKLPSKDEWQQMFLGTSVYYNNRYDALNTAIKKAGGTQLNYYQYYWTSSSEGGKLYLGDTADFDDAYSSSSEYYVRACFAF